MRVKATGRQGDEKLLASKQLNLLYQRHPFTFWSTLLLSGGLASVLWTEVSHTALLFWLLTLWLVMAVRDVYARKYFKLAREKIVDHEKWQLGMQLGAVATGLCWGTSVFILPSLPISEASLMLLFVLVSASAFAGVAMAAVPWVAQNFLLTALLPTTFWLFSFGESLTNFMGAITLGYLVLMLLFSRQTHRTIHGLLSTTERNNELAVALEQVKALERESALFRHIVDKTRDPAIFVANTRNRYGFDYVNEAACAHFGASREEILSWHVSDWDPHYDADKVDEHHAALKRAGRIQFESEHLRASGERFPVEVTLNLVEFEGESFAVGYFRSLEKQKKEEAIRLQYERDITRQESEQRMIEALRASEQEFRSLAENLPDVVVRYDRECRRVYVNPAWEIANGIPATEVLGKSPQEMSVRVKPISADFERMLRGVMATGQTASMELNWLDEAGGPVCFELHASPEFDAHDNAVSVLTVARDVSEKKEAQRHTEQFVANFPGFVYSYRMTPDGRDSFPFVSPGIEKLYGLTPADVKENTAALHALAHPDDAPGVIAALAESARTLSPVHLEYRICRPGLPERWAEFRSSPVRETDGSIVWHGIMLDIDERKRAEAALRIREREFISLAESSPDNIVRYDSEGRHLYLNGGLLRQLGVVCMDEVIGKRPGEVWTDGRFSELEEAVAQVVKSGQRKVLEVEEPGLEGNVLHHQIYVVPERDEAGRISGALAFGRNITESVEQREQIYRMAFYDDVTSLPNRALFNDRLQQLLSDAVRHKQHAGVMMLDLDRFKAVNDSLGHAAGDDLLREAATRLARCVRSYDTVARLGGDEFAILLPEVRADDDLGRVAEKMLASLNEPFVLEGKEVFVSGSIGIALFPGDGEDSDVLLRHADSAMYAAKRAGRANFRFYSRELTDSANERLQLESELRRGFAKGELLLYYQPKVRLTDGGLLGAEALLRWQHPARGMVAPDKFIPIAEDSGLIVEIGEWVLREACRTVCAWNGAGKPLHKVAVNLSARQFQQGDLVQTVGTVLAQTGCRPAWIELEITESLLLDEESDALRILEALRAMGITIAIDDFGTGYSSLGYLARFPIDVLKIDRSFTGKVQEGGYHTELVKAISSIAQSLKQEIVAEGVETEVQAALLREYGCHVAQGYFYGKPMGREAFEAYAGALSERGGVRA